jgi:molybdate transport system substrate-binding protein
VLVVNRENGVSITSIDELVEPSVQRIAIANPELAPYGMAARQALQTAGIWQQVEPKIVQGANVRQALQYVQTGDAPAGLVALSIADVSEVDYSLVNEDLYAPLRQAMAIVATTDQEEIARDFAKFILAPEGQAILAEHGFAPPGAP